MAQKEAPGTPRRERSSEERASPKLERGPALPSYDILSKSFEEYRSKLVWWNKNGTWMLVRVRSLNAGSGQINVDDPETGTKLGSPVCTRCFEAVPRPESSPFMKSIKDKLADPAGDQIPDDEVERKVTKKLDFGPSLELDIMKTTADLLTLLQKLPLQRRIGVVNGLVELVQESIKVKEE